MSHRRVILIFVALALVAMGLVLLHRPKADPKDLAYWLQAGAGQDWSKPAASGQAQAEFYQGLSLVRSNIIIMVSRVPRFAAVPVVGKRFFEKKSYEIDNRIAQDQLLDAYRWIRKAADQGYPPAREALKLFAGRVPAAQP